MKRQAEKKHPWRVRLGIWIVYQLPKLMGFGLQVIRQDARSGDGMLKHAPMCGANHYHHTRPITTKCTCGAEQMWRQEQQAKASEATYREKR